MTIDHQAIRDTDLAEERALADDLAAVLMDIDADYDDEDVIATVLARYREARQQ